MGEPPRGEAEIRELRDGPPLGGLVVRNRASRLAFTRSRRSTSCCTRISSQVLESVERENTRCAYHHWLEGTLDISHMYRGSNRELTKIRGRRQSMYGSWPCMLCRSSCCCCLSKRRRPSPVRPLMRRRPRALRSDLATGIGQRQRQIQRLHPSSSLLITRPITLHTTERPQD